MGAHFRFLPTGDRIAGQLVGHDLRAVPDPFLSSGRSGRAQTGARAAATAHHETRRAPTEATDTPPTFHCPLWPECGCPGGVMRPECPGLKSRVGAE